jgi:hypothetical protein
MALHSISDLLFIFKIATLTLCSTFISERYLLFIAAHFENPVSHKQDVAKGISKFIVLSLNSLFTFWTAIQNCERDAGNFIFREVSEKRSYSIIVRVLSFS